MPYLRQEWGCEGDGYRSILVSIPGQPALEFRRCPVALLRDSPRIATLAAWASWAHYWATNGSLLVHTDGEHLSALGHEVVELWSARIADAEREAMDQAKAKQTQAEMSRNSPQRRA